MVSNPMRIIVISAILMFLASPSSSPLAWINYPGMDADGYHPANNRSPDLNSDGRVDLVDFVMFANAYPPNPYDICVDLDISGGINLSDFAHFGWHWPHVGAQLGLCN